MTHQVQFTKMHGLGNDFIVIDNRTLELDFPNNPIMIQAMAERRIGIGFDQLLLIQPSTQADFFCRIFNSDGSEAKQCGNGLRCVARYVYENALIDNTQFSIETISGVFPVTIHSYDAIQVEMNVPFIQDPLAQVMIHTNNGFIKIPYTIISAGNLHAIATVESINSENRYAIANAISSLPHFPDGVNVGLMQILSPNHILLRTFERGAGETPACGSNACAAIAAGISNKQLDSQVTVELLYGLLQVEWQGAGSPVLLTGPAANVFNGVIAI